MDLCEGRIRITHDNYSVDNIKDIRLRLENGCEIKLSYYQEDGDELDNIYICRDVDNTLVPCVRYLYLRDGFIRHDYDMRRFENTF